MIKSEFVVGHGKVYSPCYAMASRNPVFRSRVSAYSRWSTRLGSPERAFDDECTSSGHIANTPQAGLPKPRLYSSEVDNQDDRRLVFFADDDFLRGSFEGVSDLRINQIRICCGRR
jgi:hypothetical protein